MQPGSGTADATASMASMFSFGTVKRATDVEGRVPHVPTMIQKLASPTPGPSYSKISPPSRIGSKGRRAANAKSMAGC